jgi:RNA polymerase sigma-70 factor (ECF subfamily)
MNGNSVEKMELRGEFVLKLTEAQPRLLGFLLKRLGNREKTRDVLHEVNLVLSRKAPDYDPATAKQ